MPDSAEDRHDLATFLGRTLRLSSDATVRLQSVRDGQSTVAWAIVLGTLVRREFHGRLDAVADTAVSAVELARANSESASRSVEVELPSAVDSKWRGTIPPASGWQWREDIPASSIIETVAAAGASLTDLDDNALNAAADSMLSQTLITVDVPGAASIGLPLRTLVCLTRMGFLGRADAGQPNDVARIASNGSWVVIATTQGAAYRRSESLDLLRLL